MAYCKAVLAPVDLCILSYHLLIIYLFMSVVRFHFIKAAIFSESNFKALIFLFSGGGGWGVTEIYKEHLPLGWGVYEIYQEHFPLT